VPDHDPSPPFVSGLDLARSFYDEVLAPALSGTPHSAARLGWGSDVLGFDDERSTDHGWGPHAQLFVPADETATVRVAVAAALPETFRGWPVRFGWDAVPVEHHVEVSALGPWLESQLGFDALAGIETHDWLTVPQERLLEVTAGAVFHDGLGELGAVRRRLAWYPRDVWLWLLASAWRRIAQEEAFVGRTKEVGDDLGSRIIMARLAREVVRLVFLIERRYAPYSKWLGSGFARLDPAGALAQPLRLALDGNEDALLAALEDVARRHNSLGLTEEVEPSVRSFHARPYRVIGGGRFAEACLEAIEDEWLRGVPLTGAVDQVTDVTDVLTHPVRWRRLRALYESET
jgi:Domain of unknown function (DUF4037)